MELLICNNQSKHPSFNYVWGFFFLWNADVGVGKFIKTQAKVGLGGKQELRKVWNQCLNAVVEDNILYMTEEKKTF